MSNLIKQMAKIRDLKLIADCVMMHGGGDVRSNPAVDEKYRRWTVFKLLCHLLYIPLYTSIISKYFAEFYYVDLFAGSGFGIYNDEYRVPLALAGSPLIALASATVPWTGVYLNDLNSARCHLLKKRVEVLVELSKKGGCKNAPVSTTKIPMSSLSNTRISISSADANTVIYRIMDEIEKRHSQLKSEDKGCHAYFFVDPYGFQFRRDSLERILRSSVRSDIFILVNTKGVALQVLNRYRALSLRKSFSDEALKQYVGNDFLSYVEQFAKQIGKKVEDLGIDDLIKCTKSFFIELFSSHEYVVEFIDISTPSQGQVFDLIFATKKTKRGNPYINAVRYIREVYVTRGAQDGYKAIDLTMRYIHTGDAGLLGYLTDVAKAMQFSSIFARFGSANTKKKRDDKSTN